MGAGLPDGIYFHTKNANWHFYCHFGKFFSILVCCTKKNLATLDGIRKLESWQFGSRHFDIWQVGSRHFDSRQFRSRHFDYRQFRSRYFDFGSRHFDSRQFGNGYDNVAAHHQLLVEESRVEDDERAKEADEAHVEAAEDEGELVGRADGDGGRIVLREDGRQGVEARHDGDEAVNGAVVAGDLEVVFEYLGSVRVYLFFDEFCDAFSNFFRRWLGSVVIHNIYLKTKRFLVLVPQLIHNIHVKKMVQGFARGNYVEICHYISSNHVL
jgi:hypothetical protein